MQATEPAIAITKTQRRREADSGPPPIPMDELRCCDCAYCGRELVGVSHRKYAHHFGMLVAVMVHDRPYCPTCSQTATSRTFTCMTCQGKSPCLATTFISGLPYCCKCSEPAEPAWRNVDAIDRHATPAPGLRANAVEMHADAAAA